MSIEVRPEPAQALPPCILCGKPLTAIGEMQDMVCAGRPGEDISASCTMRLQAWMRTSMFAEALKSEWERGRYNWETVAWKVALDYWQERGGLPPLEAGQPDPLLEAA